MLKTLFGAVTTYVIVIESKNQNRVLWLTQAKNKCSLFLNRCCFERKHFFLSSKLAGEKPTTLLSHSALRRSNTTALQQLPVGDHGGRMNTQMKGSAMGERRLSAKLKKCEALRPHTSARPSSLNNAGGEKEGIREEL